MTGKTKWLGAVLALVLILLALPLGAFAQGEPRQGNPPPGQTKDKGNQGDNGNDGAAAVNAVGQVIAQGSNQARLINIRARRLIGLPIINRAGKQIAEVADVLINITGTRQSGNPQQPASGGPIHIATVDFVLAQFGGTLGWGAKQVPVPLTALRLHLVDGQALGFDDNLAYFPGTEPGNDVATARKQFFNKNALVLAGDQPNLDNVPQYSLEGLRHVKDPAWDRSVRAYWQGLGTTWPETNVSNGQAYRVNSVRSLDQFGVRELAGDDLGGFDDVLLTLALAHPAQVPLPPVAANNSDDNGNNGAASNTANTNSGNNVDATTRALAASLPIVGARADYALVNHGGWWGLGAHTTPLPLTTLIMDRNYNQRSIYTEADQDLLNNAPTVDSQQGTELNDPNFFTRVREYWQQAGF